MSNPVGTSFLNQLAFTPATLFGFGFQTTENIIKSSAIYNNVTGDIVKNAKNLTIQISDERIQGFTQNRNEKRSESVKSAITTANVVNVLGYIPFVGRLIGAIRIVAAIATPLTGKQKAAHIIRGLSEVTGFNKIRLVIDIAATALHFAKKAFPNNNSGLIPEKK